MNNVKKAFAFFQADFLNESSYKLAFIGQLVGIFFAALSFFFLSKLFGHTVSPHLARYGDNYFSFVLIGVAFASYLQVSLRAFSNSIRNAQVLGTLEAILCTQTEVPTIIICSSLYSFFIASLRVIAFILIGALVLGLDVGKANIFGCMAILIITIICFSSLGIMSASFIMVIKKGDPLNWLFINLSWLIGGVFYPISILPRWMQKISYALPITYSLEGMRFALLKGHTLKELLPHIIPLCLFSLIMLPVSIVVFRLAVRKAKTDGSLTHY